MPVVKLIKGTTKKSPTSELNLAETGGGRNISLPFGGFAPANADKKIAWSGQSLNHNSQKRSGQSRDVVEQTITLDLRGNNRQHLDILRGQIEQYCADAWLFNDQRRGESVWLKYRLTDDLADKAEPVFGVWSKFREVLDGEFSWPKSLSDELLRANWVQGCDLKLTCAPYPEGCDITLANAAGLPEDEASVTLVGSIAAGDLPDSNLAVALWIEFPGGTDFTQFQLYYDSTHYLYTYWDDSESKWKIASNSGSGETETAAGATSSHTAGDLIHVMMVSNGTDIRLYVDSSLSVTRTENYSPAGAALSLYLGTKQGSFNPHPEGLDGVKVFAEEWSASEVATLYESELVIKSAGQYVARPAYMKTRVGLGGFDNVDGAISGGARDNWGVAGWIPGTAPALVKKVMIGGFSWGPNNVVGWHIGWQPSLSTITPTNQHWADVSGVSASGAASADAYYSSTTTDDEDLTKSITASSYIALLRGRYTLLARIRCTGTTDLKAFTEYLNSSSRTYFDTLSVGNTTFQFLRRVSDIHIDYEDVPAKFDWGIRVERGGASIQLDVDFYMLIPNPVYVEMTGSDNITMTSSYSAVIYRDRGVILNGSGQIERLMSRVGPPIELWPGHYNYVWVVFGKIGSAYSVTVQMPTIAWVVTPRWVS